MIRKFLETIGLKRSIENPRTPLTGANLDYYLGGTHTTKSGTRVGVGQALSYSPVWSAVSLISEDIMRIPWCVHREERRDNRLFRERDSFHPVDRLLSRAIAPMEVPGRMTSDVWKQLMIVHALLYKGAYTIVHRSRRNGQPERLEWVHSDRVEPEQRPDGLWFIVKPHNKKDGPSAGHREIPEDSMFYINGLQIDDLCGLSLVAFARNSIGRQLAAEEFTDDFFNNGAVPHGFIKNPQPMDNEALKNWIRRFRAMHSAGNRHTPAVLDAGQEWQGAGVDPSDALMIDMLQFGPSEVSRWFRVPLHRLGDPSRQGWNTTEEENTQFLQSTLGSWICRLEMQADDKLFRENEKGSTGTRYYTKFDVRQYARGNTKDRTQYYKDGVLSGWLTRNEARQLEDLNVIDGLDEPLSPLNMGKGTEIQDSATKTEDSRESPQIPENTEPQWVEKPSFTARQIIAFRDLLGRDMERMAKRLGNAAITAAKQTAKKNTKWFAFTNSLEDQHESAIREAIEPTLTSISCFVEVDANELTPQLINETRELMLIASECQPDELESKVKEAADKLIERSREITNKLFEVMA